MVLGTGLTASLIALSCNLDNVGVGISYGTRGIRLPLATNLLIALLTAAGTYVAMVLGQQVFMFFPPSFGALLGGGILVIMGVWVMMQEIIGRRQATKGEEEIHADAETASESWWGHLLEILQEPLAVDYDKSGHIDLKEGTILGLALMLNNLPNGVAAAMIKLPPLLTTVAVGILSLLTFWLGISIGRYVGDHSQGAAWTWVVSGIILIGIGLAEIFLALPWKI